MTKQDAVHLIPIKHYAKPRPIGQLDLFVFWRTRISQTDCDFMRFLSRSVTQITKIAAVSGGAAVENGKHANQPIVRFVVVFLGFLLISAIFIENKTRQKGGKIRGIFDYERMRNRRVMLASSFQIHSEFHQRALTQRQTSESSRQKNNRPKHIEIIEADNEIEYR